MCLNAVLPDLYMYSVRPLSVSSMQTVQLSRIQHDMQSRVEAA
jgi:hypothetical protein